MFLWLFPPVIFSGQPEGIKLCRVFRVGNNGLKLNIYLIYVCMFTYSLSTYR